MTVGESARLMHLWRDTVNRWASSRLIDRIAEPWGSRTRCKALHPRRPPLAPSASAGYGRFRNSGGGGGICLPHQLRVVAEIARDAAP